MTASANGFTLAALVFQNPLKEPGIVTHALNAARNNHAPRLSATQGQAVA